MPAPLTRQQQERLIAVYLATILGGGLFVVGAQGQRRPGASSRSPGTLVVTALAMTILAIIGLVALALAQAVLRDRQFQVRDAALRTHAQRSLMLSVALFIAGLVVAVSVGT